MDRIITGATSLLAPLASYASSLQTRLVDFSANPYARCALAAVACKVATEAMPFLVIDAERFALAGWFKRNVCARVIFACALPTNLLHHVQTLFNATLLILVTIGTRGIDDQLTRRTFQTLSDLSRVLNSEYFYFLKMINPKAESAICVHFEPTREGEKQFLCLKERMTQPGRGIESESERGRRREREEASIKEMNTEQSFYTFYEQFTPTMNVLNKSKAQRLPAKAKKALKQRLHVIKFAALLLGAGIANGMWGTVLAVGSVITNLIVAFSPKQFNSLNEIAEGFHKRAFCTLRDTLNLHVFLFCAIKYWNPEAKWKIRNLGYGMEIVCIDNKEFVRDEQELGMGEEDAVNV